MIPAPGRPARRRRVAPARALAGVLAAAVGLAALVVAAEPAGAQGCGPAPSGQVAVALVVDDAVSAPSERCVIVGARATGYDVLVAAGHTLRIEMGFLCAIDGVPATGCGNRPDFNGAYWRYFHAAPGGTWGYSSVGGGGYRMPERCAVEGWRFASSSSEAIAPRPAPPAVTCDAPPATTPPAAPAPTAAPVAGAGGGASGGAAPGPGPGAAPGGAAPGEPVPAPTSVPADDAATTVPVVPDTTPDTTTTAPPAGGSADGTGTDEVREERAAATTASRDAGGGGSSAVGPVVAVLLVGALGGAAWWRSRLRRRGEESVAGP